MIIYDNLDGDIPRSPRVECGMQNAVRLGGGGAARKPSKHVPRRRGQDGPWLDHRGKARLTESPEDCAACPGKRDLSILMPQFTTSIYNQHGVLTFKKRSTLFETSVANLPLVIGDGLRFQSFVLICNDCQTGFRRRAAVRTCWVHGGWSGNYKGTL